MTVIDDAAYAAWAARLSGARGTGGLDGGFGSVPDWLLSNVIRLDGPDGMLQLSNFGAMAAHDPEAFECALLRFPVGETMLYSTISTPHTVTYTLGADRSDDIIIIGTASEGTHRLRSADGVQTYGTGRMAFMSSLAASSDTHIGLTETTGVVVPVGAIPGHHHVLERGVDLFPDTPLTRATSVTLARLLKEWLGVPDPGAEAVVGTETMLLSLVRVLFEQFSSSAAADRASHVLMEARNTIERRHRDSAFGIDELADALHVSRRQLFRLFAKSEQSAAALLLDRRLATAKEEILRTPLQGLTVVAQRSGFADASALRMQFNKHFGVSPRAFRENALAQSQALAEAMLLTGEQERDAAASEDRGY